MNSSASSKKIPTKKRLKGRAKALARAEGISLSNALDKQARGIGIDCFPLVPAPSSVIDRNPPLATHSVDQREAPMAEKSGPQPMYSTVIAGCTWSLELGRYAPELWLRRPDGFAPFRASELGIFPVLHPPGTFFGKLPQCWVLTRYTSYSPVHLPEMTSEDANELARHFGISVAKPRCRDYREVSELLFLQSPAFAALRSAIRKRTVTQPDLAHWSYGLTSIWAILVAMGDDHFQEAGAGTAKYLMSTLQLPRHDWWDAVDNLVTAKWAQVPIGDLQLEAAISEVVPRWMGTAKSIPPAQVIRQWQLQAEMRIKKPSVRSKGSNAEKLQS